MRRSNTELPNYGTAKGRTSVPSYYDPVHSFGGLGVVPRRSFDPVSQSYLSRIAIAEGKGDAYSGVRDFAMSAPLHLLRFLMEDALAQKALDNDLTIGFGTGFRIVAHKDYKDGRGTIDDDGTNELMRLWSLYDPSGGYAASLSEEGIQRIARNGAERINDSGEMHFEAVIARRGEGITQIFDADPLTFRYRDEKGTNRRLLEQRQRDVDKGWKEMDRATFFTNAWRSSSDNPHGCPRYGAWLHRGLRKKARERNLHDWLHALAWPRFVTKFDIDKAVQFAEASLLKEKDPDSGGYVSFLRNPDGTYQSPYEWAVEQREILQGILEDLNSSDIIVVDAAGDVNLLNPANLTGLADVWKMERIEDVQSLLQLMHMMGINEGGALSTAAEAMWNQYALSLSGLRTAVAGPLCALGNLHFRALGVDMIAVPEIEPVKPMDVKAAEEAKTAERENLVEQCVMGLISPEELAVKLSRTGAADPVALADYIQRRRESIGATNPAATRNPMNA